MLPLNSMFAMADSKTIKDTLMENEGYLEKVIEKLPYFGKQYKLDKEKERQRAEKGDEEPEQEQTNEKEVKQVEKTVTPVLTYTESYTDKIKNNASKLKDNAAKLKNGVSSYWNSFFVSKKNEPQGITLPTEGQYIINTVVTQQDVHQGIASC